MLPFGYTGNALDAQVQTESRVTRCLTCVAKYRSSEQVIQNLNVPQVYGRPQLGIWKKFYRDFRIIAQLPVYQLQH